MVRTGSPRLLSKPPTTVNDSKGRPVKPLRGEGDHAEWELMTFARLRAAALSVLLVEALDRIRRRYEPTFDDVAAAFQAQFISERDAGLFARALGYYWQGHYGDAARVALPGIEAVIRSVVEATSGGSYVEPTKTRDGHESAIGSLIARLEGRLPDEFRRDLRAVLAGALGLNLRNAHLHGVEPAQPENEAAIILCTAARFTLISASREALYVP